MTNYKTAWRVDEDGRLLSPDGAFVALLREGVIFFYDKRRGTYVSFTMADWWALMAELMDISDHPPSPPSSSKRSAGSWGDK